MGASSLRSESSQTPSKKRLPSTTKCRAEWRFDDDDDVEDDEIEEDDIVDDEAGVGLPLAPFPDRSHGLGIVPRWRE